MLADGAYTVSRKGTDRAGGASPSPTTEGMGTCGGLRAPRTKEPLEGEARGELEHAGRVHVGEGRNHGIGGACRRELSERRDRRFRVAVDRLSAAQVVSVVEEVEALEAEDDGRAAADLDLSLEESVHLLGRAPAERGLGEDLAVDDGAIVGDAVAVVVHAGRGVEGTRRGELPQDADGDVPGEAIDERDDAAMPLVYDARAALLFAEAHDVAVVGTDAVAVRLGRVGRLGERVGHKRLELRVAVAQLRLEGVVLGLAEVHEDVDLSDASVDREDRTGRVGGGDAA